MLKDFAEELINDLGVLLQKSVNDTLYCVRNFEDNKSHFEMGKVDAYNKAIDAVRELFVKTTSDATKDEGTNEKPLY